MLQTKSLCYIFITWCYSSTIIHQNVTNKVSSLHFYHSVTWVVSMLSSDITSPHAVAIYEHGQTPRQCYHNETVLDPPDAMSREEAVRHLYWHLFWLDNVLLVWNRLRLCREIYKHLCRVWKYKGIWGLLLGCCQSDISWCWMLHLVTRSFLVTLSAHKSNIWKKQCNIGCLDFYCVTLRYHQSNTLKLYCNIRYVFTHM